MRVRNLVGEEPGIDDGKLDAGVVCWNQPEQVNGTTDWTKTDKGNDQEGTS